MKKLSDSHYMTCLMIPVNFPKLSQALLVEVKETSKKTRIGGEEFDHFRQS